MRRFGVSLCGYTVTSHDVAGTWRSFLKMFSAITPSENVQRHNAGATGTAADRAAPPAIMIDPPRPDAVPARSGRTDIMPAAALGIVRPFPIAANAIRPKKLTAGKECARRRTSRRFDVHGPLSQEICLLFYRTKRTSAPYR